MFKSESTSFHYFSPRIPNLLNYGTSNFGKWGKKPLNGTSKVNTLTHRRTDRRTFRLIEGIDPDGQCFEKWKKLTSNKEFLFFVFILFFPTQNTCLARETPRAYAIHIVPQLFEGICWSSHGGNHFFGSSGDKDQLPGH